MHIGDHSQSQLHVWKHITEKKCSKQLKHVANYILKCVATRGIYYVLKCV